MHGVGLIPGVSVMHGVGLIPGVGVVPGVGLIAGMRRVARLRLIARRVDRRGIRRRRRQVERGSVVVGRRRDRPVGGGREDVEVVGVPARAAFATHATTFSLAPIALSLLGRAGDPGISSA
jgi:hypothetical protein